MKVTLFKNQRSRVINVTGDIKFSTLLKKFEKIKLPMSPKDFPNLSWFNVKDFFWANKHPVMENAQIAFDGNVLYIYSALTDLFVFRRNKNMLNPTDNNILKIFQDIALPYVKDYFEAKAEKILEICKVVGRNCYIDENIGVIVKARRQHAVSIITHMDLIKPFYKGFWSNKTLLIDPKTNIVRGALDNTITNAVVIDLLLSGDIPDNVEIVFTNDEETGMNASSKYASKNKKVSYINLDVTNEFKNKSASIEYDCPNAKTLLELKTLFKNDSVGFTSYRVADDLDSIVEIGLRGLSFCLPTKKTIHSWENETTLSQINEYRDLLKKLLANLPKFGDQDLEKINKKVLSCSSSDEMLKASPMQKSNSFKKSFSLFEDSEEDNEATFEVTSYVLDDIFNILSANMLKLPDADDLYEAVSMLLEEGFVEVGFLKRIGKKISKIFTNHLVKLEITQMVEKNNIKYVGFSKEYLRYFM